MIESYISKVVSYLPFKQRKDIADELRSIIHDACNDDFSDANIKSVLIELGTPRDLALQYGDQSYLIGPQYYARYKELLLLVSKISLPIIYAITFIGKLIHILMVPDSLDSIVTLTTNIIIALMTSLTSVLTGALSLFAIVTIIFVIFEKTQSDIELFEFDYDTLTKPVSNKHEGSYLVEGIITIIGVILAFFILFNPQDIVLGSINGHRLTLIGSLFNEAAFNKLMPFGIILLLVSFVIGIVKLIQRKESKTIYLLDILSSTLFLGFIIFAINIPNLFNSIFWNDVFTSMGLLPLLNEWGNMPIIITFAVIIIVSIIDIASNIYKLLKLKTS